MFREIRTEERITDELEKAKKLGWTTIRCDEDMTMEDVDTFWNSVFAQAAEEAE